MDRQNRISKWLEERRPTDLASVDRLPARIPERGSGSRAEPTPRFWLVLGLLILALINCRAISLPFQLAPTLQVLPTALENLSATQTALHAAPGAAQIAPTPSSSLAVATPSLLGETTRTPFTVRVHPDGGLFVGDQVSFEVIAPSGVDLSQAKVSVALEGEPPFAEAQFEQYGIVRRPQATLLWVWDTRGLSAGQYRLVFSLEPGGERWAESFTLQPAAALPPGSDQVAWAQERSQCCVIYYMTHTAAARDMADLLERIDRQAQAVGQKLAFNPPDPVAITFLPRLLGHGGFANDQIHVSYLDRNYAGGVPDMVIHHELVHIFDAALEAEYAPSLLVEGLAVYLSGGHFKPEPLMPRAAALLESWGEPQQPGLGWYLSLEALANDFYHSQHEIGYLEAGALVEFMVETWGWEAFADFYGDIPERSTPSQALDEALRLHFGFDLAELEARFIAALRRQPYDAALLADVRLTVQHYDTVRRYQQALDPSAYFMTVWLPDSERMRQEGIVADYLRHPETPLHVVLELMLANAGEALVEGRYPQVEQHLFAANAVLDALEQGWDNPLDASLLAADFAAAAQALQRGAGKFGASPGQGIKIQRLWIEGDQGRALISLDGARLVEARLTRNAQGTWRLLERGSE